MPRWSARAISAVTMSRIVTYGKREPHGLPSVGWALAGPVVPWQPPIDVRGDDEVARGVDGLAGAHHRVPPAAGVVARLGGSPDVAVAGERVGHVDGVVARGVELAPGLVGDRYAWQNAHWVRLEREVAELEELASAGVVTLAPRGGRGDGAAVAGAFVRGPRVGLDAVVIHTGSLGHGRARPAPASGTRPAARVRGRRCQRVRQFGVRLRCGAEPRSALRSRSAPNLPRDIKGRVAFTTLPRAPGQTGLTIDVTRRIMRLPAFAVLRPSRVAALCVGALIASGTGAGERGRRSRRRLSGSRRDRRGACRRRFAGRLRRRP